MGGLAKNMHARVRRERIHGRVPSRAAMPTEMRTLRCWLHAKWRDLALIAFRDPKNPMRSSMSACREVSVTRTP